MKKFMNKHRAFLFGLFFLLISCNESTEKKTPDNPTTDSVTASTTIPEPNMLVGGKLDTLWIDSLGFDTLLNKKLVFSFTFGQLDTLTMHGWTFQRMVGRDFERPPTIKLKKGKASSFSYGPGTYFGDLVLNEVKAIKKVLRDSSAKYVLFAPEKDGEHIRYKVFVSREDPIALAKIEAAIPTSGIANPSPPKNR